MNKGLFGERVIPGHSLNENKNNQPGSYYASLVCDCGYEVQYGRLKKNGVLNAWAMRTWEGHLELVGTPADTFIKMGIVHRARSDQIIFIFTKDYPLFDDWLVDCDARHKGYYERRYVPWYMGIETPRKKLGPKRKLHGGAVNQNDAIAMARKFLIRAQEQGSEVEYLNTDGMVKMVMRSPIDSGREFVSRIDECLQDVSLQTAQLVLQDADEYLRVARLIEMKAQALRDAYQAKLVMVNP